MRRGERRVRVRRSRSSALLAVSLAAITVVVSAPPTAAGPDPILVHGEFNGAQLWYYGAMNRDVASKRLSRYSAERDGGGELGEGLRHFNYVVSDSFFEMMADESLLLAFFVKPSGRYWSFPADRTLLLRRGEDTWSIDRLFVIYYWTQSGGLSPRLDALGGSEVVYLQLNDELAPERLLRDGWRPLVGRLHNLRNDDEITIFARISPNSDKGTRWNNQDRTTPIDVLLVSTAQKEARDEGPLSPRAGDGSPALASGSRSEAER